MTETVRMCDLRFDSSLFENYLTGTVLDRLLCSYSGLPKGVNYMVIGDPGVGKTTIILDMLANIQQRQPELRILFVSAEMNEIDLAIYVQRFPKFGNLDILFIEIQIDEDTHNWETLTEILERGWDIVALDENHYRIGNATVKLTPDMVGKIDRYFGILPKQSKMSQDSFGGNGVANLRNFFAQAGKKDKERIILVGDTNSRQITRVLQTSHHIIPSESFFDFAEMFMDDNRFEPESVEYNNGSQVSIRMKSLNPEYMEIAPNDEIVDNGIWLRWNPTEIAFGNYYVRLVCTNGSTQTTQSRLLRTNTLEDQATLKRMLSIGSGHPQLKQNRDKMLENAKAALNTKASLRELGLGSKLLQRSGMEEQDAAQLIPYQENIDRYEQAGLSVGAHEQSLTVSNMSVWQLFNILTAFATHNQLWPAHDTRRSELMAQSVELLNQKRDIRSYQNIYG